MKIRKKTVKLMAILAACLVLSVFTFAADTAYDSSKDPIASKSYVDAKIKELNNLLTSLKTEVSALKTEVAAAKTEAAAAKKEAAAAKNENAALKKQLSAVESEIEELWATLEFVPVRLTKGQMLYADGGSIEIVLRTGTGNIVSLDDQSISDMTVGVELKNGDSAPASHMLLIPRDDGRGLLVTSSSAWLMVKGTYEIK